jgi:hypothetical protein
MIHPHRVPAYILTSTASDVAYEFASANGMVLYGSTAYKRYVPAFWGVTPMDVDFLVPCKSHQQFDVLVSNFERWVQHRVSILCPSASPIVTRNLTYHDTAGGRAITTANMSINGKHFADLTTLYDVSMFPYKDVRVVSTHVPLPMVIKVISVEEILWRMAESVQSVPDFKMPAILLERKIRRCQKDKFAMDGAIYLSSVGMLSTDPVDIILHVGKEAMPTADGIEFRRHENGTVYAYPALVRSPRQSTILTMHSTEHVTIAPYSRMKAGLLRVKSSVRKLKRCTNSLKDMCTSLFESMEQCAASCVKHVEAMHISKMSSKCALLYRASHTIGDLERALFTRHFEFVKSQRENNEIFEMMSHISKDLVMLTSVDSFDELYRALFDRLEKSNVLKVNNVGCDTVEELIQNQICGLFGTAVDVMNGKYDDEEPSPCIRIDGTNIVFDDPVEEPSTLEELRTQRLTSISSVLYVLCAGPLFEMLSKVNIMSKFSMDRVEYGLKKFYNAQLPDRMDTRIIKASTAIKDACVYESTHNF